MLHKINESSTLKWCLYNNINDWAYTNGVGEITTDGKYLMIDTEHNSIVELNDDDVKILCDGEGVIADDSLANDCEQIFKLRRVGDSVTITNGMDFCATFIKIR